MPAVASPASPFPSGLPTRSMPVERLQFNAAPLEQRYELGDELGSGQFATVRRVIERATGQKYAAKFVRKRRYATSRRGVPRENIEREVEVLRAVRGHENVVELHEVYETSTDVILILELVSGGELFDHVCGKECLDEVEAAAFIKQILLAVRHLHSHFVVHLDIKPENVMLKTRGEPQIKLIDFGLSRQIYPGVPVKDIVGTPEFIAPEIVNYEPLSTATDMWAIGVVTYILLSGGSPFLGESRNETFANITAVNYHFSDRFFGNTSQQAKDFISRLFVRDQRHRATVEQCLNHPWIRGSSPEVEDVRRMSTVSVAQLQGYRVRSRWRRAIEIVILCNRMTKRARITIARAEAKRSDSTSAGERTPYTRYDKDELIQSAVLIACEEGNLAALKELATVHRMNLDVVNRLGETAVHVSAGAGHPQIVMFLHSRGCPISTADSRGDTPLFWAARNGHGHVIRYLCQDPDQVSINGINKSQETALHVATRYSQTDAALALLEAGANLDLQDEHGETALHIAGWHGYASLLHVLCKFEPNMSLRNQPVVLP